jgi:hypothetical protein
MVNNQYVNADFFTFNYDWKGLIDSIKDQESVPITTDPSIWKMEIPDYLEIFNLWKKANYPEHMIRWNNYYPNVHFTDELDKLICEHFNIGYRRSWISRVDPGYSAPWHWDIEDEPEDYDGPLRLSIFIKNCQPGHIFILGKEDVFFNMKEGDGIFWKRFNEYHIGMNAGLEPKYMYHLKARRI